VPELWTPVVEGPHEAFVERLHRSFAEFAEASGIAAPVVEIELADTARFVIDKILPDPGFGMITIYVHDRDDDAPDALVIPIGSIRRIELRRSPEDRVARFGFSLPAA
jgi:hypothetical protein